VHFFLVCYRWTDNSQGRVRIFEKSRKNGNAALKVLIDRSFGKNPEPSQISIRREINFPSSVYLSSGLVFLLLLWPSSTSVSVENNAVSRVFGYGKRSVYSPGTVQIQHQTAITFRVIIPGPDNKRGNKKKQCEYCWSRTMRENGMVFFLQFLGGTGDLSIVAESIFRSKVKNFSAVLAARRP
jgi:hypothetical protein